MSVRPAEPCYHESVQPPRHSGAAARSCLSTKKDTATADFALFSARPHRGTYVEVQQDVSYTSNLHLRKTTEYKTSNVVMFMCSSGFHNRSHRSTNSSASSRGDGSGQDINYPAVPPSLAPPVRTPALFVPPAAGCCWVRGRGTPAARPKSSKSWTRPAAAPGTPPRAPSPVRSTAAGPRAPAARPAASWQCLDIACRILRGDGSAPTPRPRCHRRRRSWPTTSCS